MSWGTYGCCFNCWDAHHPDSPARPEQRERVGPEETCCYCGAKTTSGIYVRENSANVAAGVRPAT